MYVVVATVTHTKSEGGNIWSSTRQVPTFFLDEAVQGIVDTNHARRIARDVIDPFGLINGVISIDLVKR